MKAFIFDLDGVIAITEDIHKEAFEMAFAGYNVDMTKYNWNKDFAGKGHKYIINTVFGASPANERHIDRWVYWYQILIGKTKLVPGIKEFIEAHKLHQMIIATGSQRKSAVMLLQNHSIDLQVVSMEDVSNPKPAPDLFLYAAGRLQTKPADCIVFEDSLFGIRAAKLAGMNVIALKTTHTYKELQNENPRMIIRDFNDISNIECV